MAAEFEMVALVTLGLGLSLPVTDGTSDVRVSVDHRETHSCHQC